MKKFFIVIICLIIALWVFSCTRKNSGDTPGARLHDIPASTATSDAEITDAETDENDDEDELSDNNPDRNEETDRAEIKNNLRDAKELIEAGALEDAAMIIKGLQTRDLTDAEKKELKELQKMMITISD